MNVRKGLKSSKLFYPDNELLIVMEYFSIIHERSKISLIFSSSVNVYNVVFMILSESQRIRFGEDIGNVRFMGHSRRLKSAIRARDRQNGKSNVEEQ